MRIKANLLLFSLGFILFGCSEPPYFEEYKSFEAQVWAEDEPVEFEVMVEDTTAFYDLNLHLRHAHDYPYRNMYTFITLVFPNQKTMRDTLNIWMSDPAGRWYGEGISSVKNLGVRYKEKVQFPLKGKYIFEVKQGMRDEYLKGLENLGLEIRKSEIPE